MDNNILVEKEQIRQLMASRASSLDPAVKAEKDASVLRELSALPELRAAGSVFCYVSDGGEVDTRRLLPALLRSGRRVLVPRIDGDEMAAVEITSMDELTPGAFGILEPPKDKTPVPQGEIEFAVVPGVAFGKDGTRLGRGKGYYDKWLSSFPGTMCAIVREEELLDTLPSEPHDIRMNIIVTDKQVIRISTAENTIEAFIASSVARSVAQEEASRVTAPAPEPAPEQQETPKKEKPAKKEKEERPPRRKWGCVGAFIWLLCVIGISAALAGFGWICADDLLGLTAESYDATVEIKETDSLKEIAEKLEEAGMIKRPWLFEIFGKIYKADEKIDAGTYNVNAIMDYRALIRAMRANSSYRATVDVTIPEGFTVEQILNRLDQNGVASYEDLAEAAANYDFEYSFLEGLPTGDVNRLEGYLFPNTHTFYVGESPVNAINRLLNDFSNKFNEDLRDEAEEMGLTMHEVLTIASMIEREAASTSEMNLVSSVIHNRLDNWEHPLLQIDATIQYALEERKEYLSYEDLQIQSPYNTYLHEGLPPGPICNPGIAAIKAALRPEETNYYFYALTEDGTHEFVRTAEEQQEIINANPGAYGAN